MDQITQMTTAALPSAETLDLSKLTESEAFRALLSAIDARADEFETLGHIPRDIIALMKQARIFRSSTPTCFGGDAMAPHHFLKMVDAIGAVDGSSAWVAAFGSANTYTAALPYEAQQIMYAGGPDQVFAGGLHPVQKAVRAEGGWRVSGRWKFASGCMGADWIGVGIEGRGTSADGSDVPKVMMAVAPASEVEIIQSWNVSGMEGTGSHDTRVEDKFYSDLWICERGAPGIIDEPLYRYPAMAYQAQVHAACNLGLARAAIEHAKSVGGAAKIMVGHSRLCDRGYYLSGLAQAEATLRGARAFFYDAAEEAWESLLRGDPVSGEQTNMLRLSAIKAAQDGAQVVQECWRISGMGVISRAGRMQRHLRDSMVVTQHAAVADTVWENGGKMLAGVTPPAGFP